MIGRLKGIVDSTSDDFLILDVNGVGYRVFCSTRTLSTLPVGTVTALEIETQVREDHIHLFGFMSPSEKEWFTILTGVQGVGAKVALAIMGILSPTELTTAIASQDKTTICRANGVGPKLGLRICTELKDKVGKMTFSTTTSISTTTSTNSKTDEKIADTAQTDNTAQMDDAVSALVNLGYGRSDAFTAVANCVQELGNDATVDTLITNALQHLSSH